MKEKVKMKIEEFQEKMKNEKKKRIQKFVHENFCNSFDMNIQ